MSDSLSPLADFLADHTRLFIITGAGCSTDSGIPDYRDAQGQWKRKPPINFHSFMTDPLQHARYWARSMVGWRHFGAARPNMAHLRLARLEAAGRVRLLVTQNVDRLHERAGSRRVIDLHGRLDQVRCMQCERRWNRDEVQQWLEALNPQWQGMTASEAPDGDADLEGADFSRFTVPHCHACGGLLKPDVVFYGESVPRERVQQAYDGLQQADAVLVVGSSLMVYSSFRYIKAAHSARLPIAAINLGATRADALLDLKVTLPCAQALQVVSRVTAGVTPATPDRAAASA